MSKQIRGYNTSHFLCTSTDLNIVSGKTLTVMFYLPFNCVFVSVQMNWSENVTPRKMS